MGSSALEILTESLDGVNMLFIQEGLQLYNVPCSSSKFFSAIPIIEN